MQTIEINDDIRKSVFRIMPGKESDFEYAFTQAQTIIAGMLGYVSHQLHGSLEKPSCYLLLVYWENVEARTEGFKGSAGYQK